MSTLAIGICAHNAEKTIERAIHSAFKQTIQAAEIIIVDDCSSDKTPMILFELAQSHKKVRLLRNKSNKGVAVCRNKIIKNCYSSYLAFFDDDDESSPHRLETQWRSISLAEQKFGTDALIISHTARDVIFPNSTKQYQKTMGCDPNFDLPSGPEVAKRVLFGKRVKNAYGACPTCSQMAKIKTYLKLKGFDEQFRRSEDTEFVVRAALAGAVFVGNSEPLVTQYMQKKQKSLEVELHFHKLVASKHAAFIDRFSNYEFCIGWLDLKYHFQKKNLRALILLIKIFFKFPSATITRALQAFPNSPINLRFGAFHGNR